MPIYDRKCSVCDWSKEDCYEPREFSLACPDCGEPTVREWHRVTVIPDTFSTPLVDENMARTVQVFHSRSERKDAMRRHGVVEKVRHVEFNHSDKSPHTTPWY